MPRSYPATSGRGVGLAAPAYSGYSELFETTAMDDLMKKTLPSRDNIVVGGNGGLVHEPQQSIIGTDARRGHANS